MRNLYARTVLFLIRPVLELHHERTQPQRQEELDVDLINRLISCDSSISNMLDFYYGLKHPVQKTDQK